MGFDYVEPSSLAEAVSALAAAGPDACLVAGGTELMLRVRLGEISPRLVVGIGRLPELRGVLEEADGLSLGAATTLSAIARSTVIHRLAPLLAEVCGRTRSPQVRALATIGGVLCGASPLAEPPLALLALDARARLRGPDGERELSVGELILGPGKTALRPGEVLTRVLVPQSAAAAAYERLSRREAVEPPLVASAVSLSVDAGGVCRSARIVLGVATPRPVRLTGAEAALVGHRLDPERLRLAVAAAEAIDVRDGVRASQAYRRRMAPVVVYRALTKAAGQAGG